MSRKEIIEKKLAVLSPQYLEIIDETYQHISHIDKNSSETHLKICIKACEFDNMTLIKQHRLINDLLKSEFDNGLHALKIKILK